VLVNEQRYLTAHNMFGLPTAASNAPKKKRVASSPLKFFARVIKLSTIPQHKTITAANLPVGSLTRKYAIIGCITSCAIYTIEPS
jgi:hypothetical protein